MLPVQMVRLTVTLLLLLALSPRCLAASGPVLARLSFWVPPERMAEFGAAYEIQVAGSLAEHGLVASSAPGRATVDSVFSRLFTSAALDTFFAQRRALFSDPAWTDLLVRLGSGFGGTGPDSLIRCQLVPYRCPAIPARSVPAGGGTQRGAWRSLGVQDGLPAPIVHNLLRTPSGDIWFNGRTHITHYDGETFVTYTTSEFRWPFFLPLLQARDGSLWYSGLGGLTRYDGKTFVTFTAADGLAGDEPTCLLEDRQGHLWIGDGAGVTRYDGETFQILETSEGLAITGVSSILEDRDGILWFGLGTEEGPKRQTFSRDGGTVQYDGKTLRTWTGTDRIVDHAVYSIMQDRHGSLWFGGEGQVTRFDGVRSSTLDARDGLVGGWIATMLEDRDGDLWFGSRQEGISRFDGRAFSTFTAENGLANDQVYHLVEDEEGYLWASTRTGLSRYEGAHWTTFTPRDGLPSPYVFTVLQDRTGTLWFGTAGGLVRYDGGELGIFTAEDGMAQDQAHWVVEGLDGDLWIKGFIGNLGSRYDGETFTPFTLGDSLDIYLQLSTAVDGKGHVWFPTGCCGVVRYDGHDFSILTANDGLPSDQVGSVAVDQSGHVLFVTPEGISRYDGATITPLVLFSGSEYTVVTEDRQGRLWIGSDEGEVARYDDNELEILTFEDGLKPGLARPALEDSRGHMWIGIHGAGIVRTDGLVFQDLHQGDGLVSDAVQSIMEDRDGDFWISTDSGITRYRPSTVPPAVRIKEVVADRSYGTTQEITLPSSQDLIQFTFQGRSFTTPPDRMAYVYRLQGHEAEWQTTRRTEVRYLDLPIGDYVFQLKAVDRDLNYSVPTNMRVLVRPPYLQFALTGCLGLALIGLVIAGRYGAQRKRERDAARTELVGERRRHIEVQSHDIECWRIDDFVGRSPAMQGLLDTIGTLQHDDGCVLVTGEAGTGKELIARAIHSGSSRRDAPFVPVRCAGLPKQVESLTERTQALSLLFGHTRGAFAGAEADRKGLVQQAHGGTLFFDEVGLLPLPLQTHLLRVLTTGQVRSTGATQEEPLDVRVMAATSEDLELQVQVGVSHAGLYDYLAVHRITVAPLRQRIEDIAPLAQQIIGEVAARLGLPVQALGPEVLATLQNHRFPGNERELRRRIEQALATTGGRALVASDLRLG